MTKFHIKTYGCKLNQADSELMRGLLLKEFEEASEKEADFVVLNTCAVVEKTERKVKRKMEELKKEGKKIIVGGCLPLANISACRGADGLLGPTNILKINIVAKKVMEEKKPRFLSVKTFDKAKYSDLKKVKLENSVSAIVSVAEGCLGNCTYCATKIARKDLKSYGVENIVCEVKRHLEKGFKEIQLTSQDMAVYGLDRGKMELPLLLERIAKIEGDFRVKVGMMNPGLALKMIDELLPSFQSEKIYKFFHLPLQSGDDVLLKEMNRGYTSSDFIETVGKIRKRYKDALIATDIIVGHPKEDEEAFKNTIKVLKKVKPEVTHIFRYSKRVGSKDYALKDWPDRIKKDRSRILTRFVANQNLKIAKKYLGKKLDVLVVLNKGRSRFSRTNCAKAVVLEKGRLGEFKKVKITGYNWNYLKGV